MPESDVSKMKVADLKRELKLRGLPLNGNKNELQDRLQTALLEGDISLEDSAIADAIDDDDVSLTDEDEHKLLGDADEHEDLLLKSPVSTPTAAPDLLLPGDKGLTDSAASAAGAASAAPTAAPLPAKKIVLKRNNSQLLTDQLGAAAAAGTESTGAKENAAPAEASPPKTQRKPIVIGSSNSSEEKKAEGESTVKKPTELTNQERLELRAKKFGIASEAAPKVANVNKSSSASITANKGNKETDEQQKEALKRRAERFGCVVPEKTPKSLADERLQKRKERFGVVIAKGGATGAADSGAGATANSTVWAEKAKARLERFKGSNSTTTTTTAAVAAPTPATEANSQ